MKKLSRIIIGFATGSILMFSFATTAFAALGADYTVLTPLPDTTKSCTTDANGVTSCQTDLQKYLPAVFNLSIGVAAVMAFVMITFGGITYAVSDTITGKKDGKKYVEGAIWGLVLVIASWVILNTINPKILTFDLTIPKPEEAITGAPSPAVTTIRPMTQEEIAADAAIRSRLSAAGVAVNAGPCTQGQIKGCTNVNGLPEIAITGLINLKSMCNCLVTITGGTEPGAHATHGVGNPIVDLRDDPALRSWLQSKKYILSGTNTARVPVGVKYANMTYEPLGGNPNGTSTGAHWHVVF